MPTTPDPQTLVSHSFSALQPGRRLIVLGAVHGNETCGTRAIERLLAELEAATLRIVRGSVTFVPVTNALAYQRGQRAADRNLNRNLRPNDSPQDHEERIGNQLCPLLARHEILLDLHSFHSPGQPFAMIGPPDNTGTLEPFARAAEEEALALRLGPRRLVEGWLDTYAIGVRERLQRSRPGERAQMLSTDPSYGIGTTEYMRSVGGAAITLECGSHGEPLAVEVAERAIRNTLAHLGLIDAPAPAACDDPELLRLEHVTDRLHADDRFAREWASYDPVRRGETIAIRHDGTALHAPDEGFVVFPNPAAVPGNEWFYFARRSTRVLNRS
ncbi:MAG: succinylglutamate desuccinylase/aspartoacylase family protein [Rhizobacter sp.]|nr:succinylglutamate desuccinylase/aspartoacylase family protein [Rhizobacter sp.]